MGLHFKCIVNVLITCDNVRQYCRYFRVRQYWIHEDVNFTKQDSTGNGIWEYDVALLKLNEMININEEDFLPICLPSINEDYTNNEIRIFGRYKSNQWYFP